ncbi:hypothetical protein [Streptomyces sp. LUP30]|uniref:hypothetical protein n=1 Tax=Streptomyces sp. LUP30 TaxID=1890285 RepID=UPI0008517666
MVVPEAPGMVADRTSRPAVSVAVVTVGWLRRARAMSGCAAMLMPVGPAGSESARTTPCLSVTTTWPPVRSA